MLFELLVRCLCLHLRAIGVDMSTLLARLEEGEVIEGRAQKSTVGLLCVFTFWRDNLENVKHRIIK
jgi:hypothetical protein